MPAPIRALLISGMARIGKDKPGLKCGSRAPAGPESAPAAGLGLRRADLFRKFIARAVIVDSGVIRCADDRDDGLDRRRCRLAEIGQVRKTGVAAGGDDSAGAGAGFAGSAGVTAGSSAFAVCSPASLATSLAASFAASFG